MLTEAHPAGIIVPPRPLGGRRRAVGGDPLVELLHDAFDALEGAVVPAFCSAVAQLRGLGVGLVVLSEEDLVLTADGVDRLSLTIRDARRVAPALRRWLRGLPTAAPRPLAD